MSKLLMREEVLVDGSPLPLADVLANTSELTVHHTPIKDLWSETIQSMKWAVETHMLGVDVVMPKLWLGDQEKLQALQQIDGFPVSLDAYDTTGAFALQVSRHFSEGGKKQIGIGKRPGSAPLEDQLTTLKNVSEGEPLVLLEDDMFTGGTAKHVIELLQSKGFSILSFIPGLQVSDIQEIAGVPIDSIEQFSSGDVLDIVDPRDLLFGLSQGGLCIDDSGVLYRAPYCMPYVDMTSRASIPAQKAHEFSQGIVDLNEAFFERFQSVLGKIIYIHDLAPAFVKFVDATHPNGSLDLSIDEFCEYTRIKLSREY